MTTINKLHFQRLKRLQDVVIDLPSKGVIAIMGENGIGKSTVLHALACIYKPHSHAQVKKGDHGNWWTDWFIPHTGNLWAGSRLRAFFSDRAEGTEYQKTDRWTPRKDQRRERYTRFIGLRDCMPHIEEEKQTSRFEFELSELDFTAAKQAELVQAASGVLNRQYVAIQRASKKSGLRSFLFATVSQGQPPTESSYTSHYMGAGEYKVLKLLQEVLKAQNGGLIVIEEVEVSIHDAALRRLLLWLIQQAEVKSLQIVVSTHWPRIVEFANDVHVRTLHTTGNDVVCINGYKPMALHRMTGNEADMRLISAWVEDSLAERIVQQISAELGITPNIVVKQFGSSENAFAVAAVLELDNSDHNRSLLVLDGDRYRSTLEKIGRIEKTLSGTGAALLAAQARAVRWFAQFNPVIVEEDAGMFFLASPRLPMKPERYLLDAAMRSVSAGQANPWVAQYVEFAKANVFTDPDKSVVFNLHKHFKQSMELIELFLIEAAARDSTWGIFTAQVRERLHSSAVALGLDVTGDM